MTNKKEVIQKKEVRTLYLTANAVKKLKLIAFIRETNMTALIQEAIDEWIMNNEEEARKAFESFRI